MFSTFQLNRDTQRDRGNRITRMIQWLNIRQKAVDDAKRDTPHQNVEVFHYTEVNLVRKGLEGKPCLTTEVLPHTNVDMVSYSSYDSTHEQTAQRLPMALDFINSKLLPKPGAGLNGKRVFIGEYGSPADRNTAEAQKSRSIEVIKAAMKWGCPLILYWEFYNNEVRDGKQRGYWMIDDHGKKQPVYHMHREFLERARNFVTEFKASQGRLPTSQEYLPRAMQWLDNAG